MISEEVFAQYEAVIGLEVHCQLQTESKIFASDSNQFGNDANTNISVITLAHPGTLPKINKKAFELAVKMGLACGSTINQKTFFDRKNYFYPDLPKGYQVTQDKFPICMGGGVTVTMKDASTKKNFTKFIPFNHIHLEEDAGKSIHDQDDFNTLLDYNRAGTPLIEIVSDPCIASGEEAAAYLNEIRQLVRFLNICDGNMEEGSMRADLNVSVRKKGDTTLGTKVEIKNMNSIRNLQRAAEHEFSRQINALETGEALIQETRGFDADKGTTYGMRVKETMNDYRYFPEPDLAPIVLTDVYLADIQASMPVLPRALVKNYSTDFGLSVYDAEFITETKELVAYFEETISYNQNYKTIANWLTSTIRGFLNDNHLSIDQFSFKPKSLAAIIDLIDKNEISNSTAAQKLFSAMIENPDISAKDLATRNNWLQESNSNALQTLIDEVLIAFPDKVNEYKKGKRGLIGFFVGEVMKKSKGSADPKITNELTMKALA
jgi:aspartyl-tRNA(Asn)/glutamyl-tRNA(Gln) amidotransferase subunit B